MASIVNEQGRDTSQQMSSGEALYRAIMKNNGVILSYKEGCNSNAIGYNQGIIGSIGANSQSGVIHVLPRMSCTNGNRSIASVTLSYKVHATSSITNQAYYFPQQGNVTISTLDYNGGYETLSIIAKSTVTAQNVRTNGDETKEGIITITNPTDSLITLSGVYSHVQMNNITNNYGPVITIEGNITVTLNVTSMTLSDGTVVTP